MVDDNTQIAEHERVRAVYEKRPAGGQADRYAWWQPDVICQNITRKRKLALLLSKHVGKSLQDIDMLDVGCGSGELLRQMIEWGAKPARLKGIDLLEDRLIVAREKTHPDVEFANSGVEAINNEPLFDVVSAFTVFSSILDTGFRRELAEGMWSRLRPGGSIVLFDFKMNNPRNKNVRKVTRSELRDWWPEARTTDYKTLLLAPPIARRISGLSTNLVLNLEAVAPFLRSHFYFVATKDKS